MVSIIYLSGNGISQFRHSGHWRILIRSVLDVIADAVGQFNGRVEAGESLREVDGAAVRGELADHREDRRADVG